MLGLIGCGSAGSSSPAADGAARGACDQLVGLGRALSAHTPMAGTAIDRQLQSAQDGVDKAARLDSARWRRLDHAVHDFVVALRAGHAPGGPTVIEVSDGCKQFAPPTSGVSGG
ncbi:MAG: hypothetical protein M3063_01630 [Actinomycetota bacterium]|nr:hypothetical protein [Actinomycetota bacterium]MDQ6945644.1 hypothetical protein [Actinomycetota bacterium]